MQKNFLTYLISQFFLPGLFQIAFFLLTYHWSFITSLHMFFQICFAQSWEGAILTFFFHQFQFFFGFTTSFQMIFQTKQAVKFFIQTFVARNFFFTNCKSLLEHLVQFIVRNVCFLLAFDKCYSTMMFGCRKRNKLLIGYLAWIGTIF